MGRPIAGAPGDQRIQGALGRAAVGRGLRADFGVLLCRRTRPRRSPRRAPPRRPPRRRCDASGAAAGAADREPARRLGPGVGRALLVPGVGRSAHRRVHVTSIPSGSRSCRGNNETAGRSPARVRPRAHRPSRIRISDVLPVPFGPSTARNSPRCSSKSRSSHNTRSPKRSARLRRKRRRSLRQRLRSRRTCAKLPLLEGLDGAERLRDADDRDVGACGLGAHARGDRETAWPL